MLKKNYRRVDVFSEWNFGLKQKFNIKCITDLVVFLITCIMFMVFAKLKGAAVLSWA